MGAVTLSVNVDDFFRAHLLIVRECHSLAMNQWRVPFTQNTTRQRLWNTDLRRSDTRSRGHPQSRLLLWRQLPPRFPCLHAINKICLGHRNAPSSIARIRPRQTLLRFRMMSNGWWCISQLGDTHSCHMNAHSCHKNWKGKYVPV